MSAFTEHAERELRRAGLFDKDSDYGGMLGHAVMKLVKVFDEEGHSGMSARMAVEIFNRVARYQVLTPITNAPGEWTEITNWAPGRPPCWQSNRQPDLFSNDGGKTYYSIDDQKREVKTSAAAPEDK